MNFDPSFDLYVMVGAYLIVGAIASVAAGILLGEFLDRFDACRGNDVEFPAALYKDFLFNKIRLDNL